MSHNTIKDAGQLDIIELSLSELMTVKGGFIYILPRGLLQAIKQHTWFNFKPGGPGPGVFNKTSQVNRF